MKAAAESDSTFARWAYAHYFQFDRDKDTNNLIVKCTLCVKPKDLSTSRNSTSNLTKHLARCHANIKLVTKKRKQTEDESGEKTAKQQKLTFSHSAMLEPREVRRLVPEYVVEDMLPLSTGESPSFRNIVSKIPVQASNDTVSFYYQCLNRLVQLGYRLSPRYTLAFSRPTAIPTVYQSVAPTSGQHSGIVNISTKKYPFQYY